MKPVVLIHIEGGVASIIGGTPGVQVFILDYDSFDPHPSYFSQVIDVPMSEVQIINYINNELDDSDSTDQ